MNEKQRIAQLEELMAEVLRRMDILSQEMSLLRSDVSVLRSETGPVKSDTTALRSAQLQLMQHAIRQSDNIDFLLTTQEQLKEEIALLKGQMTAFSERTQDNFDMVLKAIFDLRNEIKSKE